MHPHPIHSILVHTRTSVSLFSKNIHSANYRGFYNLCILLLCVNLLRLVIKNFLHHGSLINGLGLTYYWPSQMFLLSLGFFIFICVLGFGCTHAKVLGVMKKPVFFALLIVLLCFTPTLIFFEIQPPLWVLYY